MVNKIKDNKGFTLVEVIVVLVIIAILAAMLIPSLISYIDKANEKKVMAKARSLFIAAQTIVSEAYADGSLWGDGKFYIVSRRGTISFTNGQINAADASTSEEFKEKYNKMIYDLAEVDFSGDEDVEIGYKKGRITYLYYLKRGDLGTGKRNDIAVVYKPEMENPEAQWPYDYPSGWTLRRNYY